MFNPISGKHSISKVVAAIHLPQELLMLEGLFSKLNFDSKISKKYQKRALTVSKTIQIGKEDVNVSNEIVNGFLFEEFDERGMTKNVLKFENFLNTQKAQLIFECNSYDRWEHFVNQLIKDVVTINKLNPILVEAISLMYIDEFEWISENKEEINLDMLFCIDGDKSLAKLKNTYNGGFTMFSQNRFDPKKGRLEERTEIYTNNDINRVSIAHTCAVRFPTVMQFDYADIKSKFEGEHLKNKEVLKLLLTENIQKQVGLI